MTYNNNDRKAAGIILRIEGMSPAAFFMRRKEERNVKDSFFRALSSPCRRRMIQLLCWRSMNVNEIVRHFHISQPSISRHLDILKRAGLVVAERRSNQMIYSVNKVRLQEGIIYLSELVETPIDAVLKRPLGEGETVSAEGLEG